MEQYKSVECSFLDRIEDFGTRRVTIVVTYIENGEQKTTESRVKTWETRNKEEFLILENGIKIRLDHIISLGGIPGPAAGNAPII